MSLVHNERVKLRATWLNALASGVILTGALAPALSAALGIVHVSAILAFGALVLWLSVGVTLHWLAWRHLGKLEP